MTRLSKLESLLSTSCAETRQKVQELIQNDVLDKDAQVKIISSPYYRTLQTARMIAEGLDEKIYENTIFVEVGQEN